MNRKTSPIYIAVFLYRFAFLLITVPLQAVIFEGIAPQIAVYIYRSDIFLIIFLAIWAVVCYLSVRYSLSKGTLQIRKGVLLSQNHQIFAKNFDSLQVTENPVFRLFKVCKVQTVASKASSTLYLSRKDTEHLADFFCPDNRKSVKLLYSSIFSVIVFSIGFSGALTGLLSVIPLFRNIAGIIGEQQAQNLLTNADLWHYIGYTALPPFLRTLSTLFLLFWAVGAFIEFQRYFSLSTVLRKDRIITEHGLLTKHLAILRKDAISALVLKQSILLALAGVFTAEAYIPANNRESKIPLLLASRKKHCNALLSSVNFPLKGTGFQCIKPPANALWSYVWKPALFLSLCSLVCIGTDALTSYRVEVHLMLFVTLWGCVWFLFCAVSHRHSFLFSDDKGLIIRTARNLSFTEAHIPREKIRGIKITQNIFQRRKGLCNLYVYIRSDRPISFRIKHIDKNKTAQLTEW